MKVSDFDYDIFKKALGKVPEDFELEKIEFNRISFKLFVSIDTHNDFALKRADEMFAIQKKFKEELGD